MGFGGNNHVGACKFPVVYTGRRFEGGQLPDQDGRSRWRWHTGPGKALEVETAMLDGITPSARLGITSFKSYDELVTAFWPASFWPRAKRNVKIFSDNPYLKIGNCNFFILLLIYPVTKCNTGKEL
jgi:hypothetical protein